MNIDNKNIYLEQIIQQLRSDENEQDEKLEDIKFLVDFEDCFDELRSNADACYTYEQMLKTIEDYILETSNEEEKNFLQYSVLVPSILRMENAYLNGNFDMGIIGMKLCESYLKIADHNIIKVYVNELAYAVKNGDVNYTKNLKKVFQNGETNLDELKVFLWDIYEKENRNLAEKIVNVIYANDKFNELAKKILEEFKNREEEIFKSNKNNANQRENINSDNLNGKNIRGGPGNEPSKDVEGKDESNANVEAPYNKKIRENSKLQAEAEFSKEHGEELKDLIIAMLNEDNQGVQNLIGVLKEFPTGSNLDNRTFNLYNRNPKVAAKILIELYNKGNGKYIDSFQLNSAKTATLEQRENSIGEARGLVGLRMEQMKAPLSSIRENLTQPRMSKNVILENINLLEALHRQAISNGSRKEEIGEIEDLLNYANLELKQLREMEALIAEDE